MVVAAGEVLLACCEKPPDVPTSNVEALGLKENAGAVEFGPDLRMIGDHSGGGDLCVHGRSYAAPRVRVGGVASQRRGNRPAIGVRVRKGRADGKPRATQWGWRDAPEGGVLAGVRPNMSGAARGVAVLPVDGGGRNTNGAIASAFVAPAAYVYICICTHMYIRLCIHPST